MRGCYGKLEFYEVFVFIFLARESAEGSGDIRGREWTQCSQVASPVRLGV